MAKIVFMGVGDALRGVFPFLFGSGLPEVFTEVSVHQVPETVFPWGSGDYITTYHLKRSSGPDAYLPNWAHPATSGEYHPRKHPIQTYGQQRRTAKKRRNKRWKK